MITKSQAVIDWEEAIWYCPGTRVELKQRPGQVDIVESYDPMMVPPIWLVNDPQPRYPEELNILPDLEPEAWRPNYELTPYPACRLPATAGVGC